MIESGYRVLVADDDALSREFLKEAFESCGTVVTAVDDGLAAARIAERDRFDLIASDLRMPRVDGIEALRRIRSNGDRTPFVLVTAYGTVDVAVEALREGVDDILIKPVTLEQVELLLARLKQNERLVAENEYLREKPDNTIVARSPEMKSVLKLVQRVAASPRTILITGESGTGKEVVAEEIHRRSGRRRFVKVNCAAVPESLLESEFFGHEAGAFTSAVGRRIGKFELADGGTLFLDEVGEIPLHLQAKFLRVLEDGNVQRVGGQESIQVDVRILCATNRDLEEAVARGLFREDLYYRLQIVPVHLSPLRTRRQDVIPLAEHFLAQDAGNRGRVSPVLTEEARRLLLGYSWPGNVRELCNLMQRAGLLQKGQEITASLLRPWLSSGSRYRRRKRSPE
ncbi:MAG: sigma-54-dependent transcriptional regulator, partial [Planctomycetota bacterium]